MPRPQPATSEFTIRFDRETWRSEDRSFMIGQAVLLHDGKPSHNGKIGVKGNIPLSGAGGMEPGLTYLVHGREEVHEKYGRQITVESWTLERPTSREGYVKYLMRCKGNLTTRGIGAATAAALYATYGPSCVEILRTDPERVSREIKHFPLESARLCSQQLIALEDTEKVRIALHGMMGGFGFPKSTINKAIDKWGAAAAENLTRNPFLVMAFRGCGFLRADAFYRHVGQQRFNNDPIRLSTWMAALKRQAYAIAYELASDTDGHIWYPVERAIKGIRDRVAGADVLPERAIELARRGKIIRIKVDTTGRRWLADRRSADAEECVAQRVAAAIREEGACWPTREEVLAADPELTDHQLAAYDAIRAGHIGLLIGSAGTGKTRLTAAIVKAILRKHGAFAACIAAPTGKAAVRCTQAMQARGVDLRARTIHSTLGVESAEDGWVFRFREGNPLPFNFIIVDEASMVPTELLASLVRARSTGTYILLVGDHCQLAPVGRGAPLRDLMGAGIPTGKLTQIHRNAGTIVRVCTAIRDRRPFHGDSQLDPDASPPRNLKFVTASREEAPKVVLDLVADIAKQGDFDPVFDVQTLVIVNKRSSLGREAMSNSIQDLLNPKGETINGTKLRIGSKVMQCENSFFKQSGGKQEHFVANGDIGRIEGTKGKMAIVRFFDPVRLVEVPLSSASGGDNDKEGNVGSSGDEESSKGGLVLAGACTVHKSQGSQWPVVIVCLDEYPGATGQFGVASRELLYTAISRAERVCYVVGREEVARKIMLKGSIGKRKTFLKERIIELTPGHPSMDDGVIPRCPERERLDAAAGAGGGSKRIAAGEEGMDDDFPADLF